METKVCTKCELEKDVKKFAKWRNICECCRVKAYRERVKLRVKSIISEKVCKMCKLNKSASEFYSLISNHDGYGKLCKVCSLIQSKEKYIKFKDKYKNRSNLNYYKSKETRKDEMSKTRRARQKIRYQKDPLYVLKRRLRNRLYYALKNKGWKKNTHFSEYIGCSYEELVSHIEEQFEVDMNWGNKGKWEIDHIIPLSSSKSPDEMYKLCHFSNLKPMWQKENRAKSNTIIKEII